MCRFGLAGKQKDFGSIPLRLSFLFKRVVVYGHCLLTLSLTIKETLKWLSSLPVLMQESFWWWQCSNKYIIYFPPPPSRLSPLPLWTLSIMFNYWTHYESPAPPRCSDRLWALKPFCAGLKPFCAGLKPFCAGLKPFCTSLNPLCAGLKPFCAGLKPFCTSLNPLCAGLKPFCAGQARFLKAVVADVNAQA